MNIADLLQIVFVCETSTCKLFANNLFQKLPVYANVFLWVNGCIFCIRRHPSKTSGQKGGCEPMWTRGRGLAMDRSSTNAKHVRFGVCIGVCIGVRHLPLPSGSQNILRFGHLCALRSGHSLTGGLSSKRSMLDRGGEVTFWSDVFDG